MSSFYTQAVSDCNKDDVSVSAFCVPAKEGLVLKNFPGMHESLKVHLNLDAFSSYFFRIGYNQCL